MCAGDVVCATHTHTDNTQHTHTHTHTMHNTGRISVNKMIKPEDGEVLEWGRQRPARACGFAPRRGGKDGTPHHRTPHHLITQLVRATTDAKYD